MTLSAFHFSPSFCQCQIVLLERRADEAVRAVRVVMEADFERDHALFARSTVWAMRRLVQSQKCKLMAVLARLDVFELEARPDRVRVQPIRC